MMSESFNEVVGNMVIPYGVTYALVAHEEDGDDYYYYDDDDYDYMDERYDQEEEEAEYNLGYQQGYQAAMERMLRGREQWNY